MQAGTHAAGVTVRPGAAAGKALYCLREWRSRPWAPLALLAPCLVSSMLHFRCPEGIRPEGLNGKPVRPTAFTPQCATHAVVTTTLRSLRAQRTMQMPGAIPVLPPQR